MTCSAQISDKMVHENAARLSMIFRKKSRILTKNLVSQKLVYCSICFQLFPVFNDLNSNHQTFYRHHSVSFCPLKKLKLLDRHLLRARKISQWENMA